jgi:hypothetical protein
MVLMSRALLLSGVLFVVSAVAPESASAERLVIESRIGDSGDADLLAVTVRSVLEKRGHSSVAAEFVTRSADRMPRENTAPSEQTITEFQNHLGRGFRRFTDVAFADATDAFTRALAMVREYPLLVTQSAEVRKDVFQAHVMLSLAYKRAGEGNAARRIIEDMIRCFPDQTISIKRFGPEPERQRRQLDASMRAQGMARLAITTPSASKAQVFVNERFVGSGSVSVDLVAGAYRVFAMTDSGPSRLRIIDLAPNAQKVVELDTVFDRAIQVQPRIALSFVDEVAQKQRETGYALALARMADVEDGAIILSSRQIGGKSAFVGRVISASGATLREGYIEADRDAPVSHLHALAAFLDGDAPGPEVQVLSFTGRLPLAQLERGSERRERKAGAFRFGVWKWAALGVGAAGVATGVTYLALDGRGTCSDRAICPSVYDTRRLGIVSLTLAGAVVGASVGAWFWDRRQDRRKRRAVTVAPSNDGWSLALSGSF